MSKSHSASQLLAGGFASLKTAIDDKLTEKTVARTYAAPVLGDRVVVRLTSERLVPAEDLAMEYLGLQGTGMSEPIAKQNRTALEFAHWALINQPKHAKYALSLVKRMKAAARKAVSKAGHAWDLYTEMAEELNKSVRHFLPPFWEQAARAYKELGNPTYAGRALNKALEAERVHSLEVDREHRRDAILEFTLSGCLSGKALTDYSKDLEKQFPPPEAYETFKDLVVRRTTGGMPPVANIGVDLARLAKLAKLDVDKEMEDVLGAIISAPSMSRAPMQFWKSMRKYIGKMIKSDKGIGVWLLVHSNPKTSYYTESNVWEWIDLLEEWGVLPLLSTPASELPKDIEIPGGRAGWIGRVGTVENSPPKRLFELIEQMAPTLLADGKPVPLIGSPYRTNLDVDVLEAFLELGVQVEISSQNMELDFSGWLREEIDHPRRNSQLQHVAKDTRFNVPLRDSIPKLIVFRGDKAGSVATYGRKLATRRSFDEAALDHPAVREIWWNYLERLLKKAESGGLLDFELAMENLTACVGFKTGVEFPAIVGRFEALNLIDTLHRTLAAGVLDEYGWKHIDELDDQGKIPKSKAMHGFDRFSWAYPYVSILDQSEIRVVGPNGAKSPISITLAKEEEITGLLPVGDSVAVLYRDSRWQTFLRWTHAPNVNHEIKDGYSVLNGLKAVVPVSDGVFYGTRMIQLGDETIPPCSDLWFHDLERFWKLDKLEYAWRTDTALDSKSSSYTEEIDPTTGKVLRKSVPKFFEENMPSGGRIVWQLTELLPAGREASPLGTKDGLIGWRTVLRRDGSIEGTGIDGRSFVLDAAHQPESGILAPVAMMDKPGSKSHWLVMSDQTLLDADSGMAIGQAMGKDRYHSGQPVSLPPMFMNHMEVRCQDSSGRLRQITKEQTSALFDAGVVEAAALKLKDVLEKPDPNRLAATVAAQSLLPKAPKRLLKGVARIVRIAATEHAGLLRQIEKLKPNEANAAAANSVALPQEDKDLMVNAGFKELVMPSLLDRRLYTYSDTDLASLLTKVSKFFKTGESCVLDKVYHYWVPLLTHLPRVIWYTFWKLATKEDETPDIEKRIAGPWVMCLKQLAESGILDLPNKFCLYVSTMPSDINPEDESILGQLQSKKSACFSDGSSHYVANLLSDYQWSVIVTVEYSAKGKLKPPKHYAIESSQPFEPMWRGPELNAFLQALPKVKALPLPSPDLLNKTAASLGMHPIGLAMVWMGELRTIQYGQEKLTKELREKFGWKVKDIQDAISELSSIAIPDGINYNALTQRPDVMISGYGSAFDQMATKWKETRSNLVAIPPEVAREIDRCRVYGTLPIKEFSELLTLGENSQLLLSRKVEFKLPSRKRNNETMTSVMDPPYSVDFDLFFSQLLRGMGLVNYLLPTGHELRKRLPVAIDAIRAYLKKPETLLPFGPQYYFSGVPDPEHKVLMSKISTIAGAYEKGSDGIMRFETPLIRGGFVPPHFRLYFRTSQLQSEKELSVLSAIMHQLTSEMAGISGITGCPAFVMKMLSDPTSRLADCNRDGVMADELWEQNPIVSVPELVDKCSKKLGASAAAAALYLQLLALHDPTTANIRKWTGWSPKQFKEFAQELIDGLHVIEAKRERAGRELFLPGGWEPLKLPNLPIETWKLSLFGYDSKEELKGGAAELIVCQDSLSGLFTRAWARIESGDVPTYEDAPVKKGRK